MTGVSRTGIAFAVIGALIAVLRQKSPASILLIPLALAVFAWADLLVDRSFQKELTATRRAGFHRLFARLGRRAVPTERIDRILSGDLRRRAQELFEMAIGLGTMAFGVL